MLTRLARRKIEAITLSAFAGVSAFGLMYQPRVTHAGVPARPVLTYVAEQPALRYVAEAATAALPTASVRTAPASRNATADLADIANPRVDSWIRRFTTDLRGSYATELARMEKYSDMILGKLDDRNMPRDLIFLAMIESGFNPKARSPARASGLWQFMAPTAKRFGLRVNRRVDQRNDPSRSTDAALKYLTQLRDRFGSWYLAAAAYNSGEGTVSRALKRVTGRTKGSDADFYRIAPRLPRETRDYVPKLVAAARIGSNPEKYGFRAD
jgi:membrane-bound lytic murein transglycosylase D